MDQAEASGKTVDDALNRALAKLGATREQVEMTILDEGVRGGLFKRGRDAIVRVERLARPQPRESSREAPDTRIPHAPPAGGRGGSGRGGAPRGGRERGAEGPGAPRDRGSRGGERPSDRGRGRNGERPRSGRAGLETPAPKLTEQDFLRAPNFADETAPETAPAPAAPREPRGNGAERADRPRSDRAERGDRGDRGDRGERGERRRHEDEPHIDPDINAEEVDFAAHIVDDMLRLLDIDAELTIREPVTPGDGLGMALAVIDIRGDDLGLLIGRRGDTLLSLQYLVNLIVTRRYPGRGGVSIDVEHYRHRREDHVVSQAKRMADRVRETGSAITLEPMSAAERRLVHLALADDPELVTNSTGEGENRKVVISTRR